MTDGHTGPDADPYDGPEDRPHDELHDELHADLHAELHNVSHAELHEGEEQVSDDPIDRLPDGPIADSMAEADLGAAGGLGAADAGDAAESFAESDGDAVPGSGLGIDVATAPELEDAELGSVLEALLLVVDTPVTVDALAVATEQPAYRIAAKLRQLAEEFTARDSGIDLREAGGGWRLYTRSRFAPYVERLLLDGARSKLTRAALETLAVVAYRQPVTRARVSAVRGVNCDAVMRTLLARGLITEAGNDPDTGAASFATTELFLERLGLSSLADLPDIASLLPDVDTIDDLSESLDSEPRFVKLAGAPAGDQPLNFDVDR